MIRDKHLTGVCKTTLFLLLWALIPGARSAFSASWSWAPQAEGSGPVRDSVHISLRIFEPALLTQDEVYLADIAECLSPLPVCLDIQTLPVAQSPLPGQRRELSLEKIKDILMKEWPIARVDLSGPAVVPLISAVRDIDAQEVQAEFQKILDAVNRRFRDLRFQLAGSRLQRPWKVRPGHSYFEFPDHGTDHQLEKSRLIRKYRSTVQARVRIHYQGETAGQDLENILSVRIQTEVKTPVAVRDLKPGEKTGPDDFTEEWVSYEKTLPALQGPVLWNENFSLRRMLTAGSPLKNNDLAKVPLIKRGQMVSLKMDEGGLEIDVRVRALSSGGKGDVIDVMYLPVRKKMSGKIVSSQLLLHGEDSGL